MVVTTHRKSIGRQIREARIDAVLTQAELAEHLRVSRQMIVRYESGKAEPSVEIMARAGCALGVQFEVDGIRIACEEINPKANLKVVPHQLRLNFGESRTFQEAIVEITPRNGRLFISAQMRA